MAFLQYLMAMELLCAAPFLPSLLEKIRCRNLRELLKAGYLAGVKVKESEVGLYYTKRGADNLLGYWAFRVIISDNIGPPLHLSSSSPFKNFIIQVELIG